MSGIVKRLTSSHGRGVPVVFGANFGDRAYLVRVFFSLEGRGLGRR
jgi:hypothetical protein